MVHPLKLIAIAAIAAAPVPALAQTATATLSSGAAAVSAAEAPKEAPKPIVPVALSDKTSLHHAVFHPRVIPSLPKVQRANDAPAIEVPEKDFRADKQGFRIAGTKLQFRQLF